MIIFEFVCDSCHSVFKIFSGHESGCLKCGNPNLVRAFKAFFEPNKGFCPKTNEIKIDSETSLLLGDFINDDEKKCEGCSCNSARYSLKSFKTHS